MGAGNSSLEYITNGELFRKWYFMKQGSVSFDIGLCVLVKDFVVNECHAHCHKHTS